jgi:hypothetical protein
MAEKECNSLLIGAELSDKRRSNAVRKLIQLVVSPMSVRNLDRGAITVLRTYLLETAWDGLARVVFGEPDESLSRRDCPARRGHLPPFRIRQDGYLRQAAVAISYCSL